MALKRAVAALLLATLAAVAQLASAHKGYDYEKPAYHYSHKHYKYTGDIVKDYSCVKPYVAPSYYKQTQQKYEAPMKVLIVICLLQYKCFDYAPSPCCTHDGYQFTHACFATCLGYTVEQITIGKCASPPPPVAAPPAPNCGSLCCSADQKCYQYMYMGYTKYECKAPPPPPVTAPPPNCGSYYCSNGQKCCKSYGKYKCCDMYSSCCGDQCCSKDEKCYQYEYMGYYNYKCKAPPPPPSPVTAPPPNCGSYYCSNGQKCCKSYGSYQCCNMYSTCCGDQCCSSGKKCVAYGNKYKCEDVYVQPMQQYHDNNKDDNHKYQQPQYKQGHGEDKPYGEDGKRHGGDK